MARKFYRCTRLSSNNIYLYLAKVNNQPDFAIKYENFQHIQQTTLQLITEFIS